MNYAQIPDDILPKVRTWSAMQLAIWADVHTMCKAGMAYYRTNEQLAERFGADDRTVRRVVSQLIACGAITAEQDGKRRILQSVTDFAERKRTKRSPDQLVPGPISPRTNQSAKEDQLVRKGGPTGPEMGDQSVLQVESIVESRVEQLVEKRPKPKKAKPERQFHDVVMPYDTDTFRAAWREWLDYKWAQHQFAYKRAQDEQTALHTLQKSSKNDERIAIHIIATSVANGWKGLFANSAKSYVGPGARTGYGFTTSGKYAHPADVLTDSSIWG